jgi:hypothetical protein
MGHGVNIMPLEVSEFQCFLIYYILSGVFFLFHCMVASVNKYYTFLVSIVMPGMILKILPSFVPPASLSNNTDPPSRPENKADFYPWRAFYSCTYFSMKFTLLIYRSSYGGRHVPPKVPSSSVVVTGVTVKMILLLNN